MRKSTKILTVVLVLAVLLLAAALAAVWFISSHVFLDGEIYSRDAEYLDLQGTHISVSQYETLQSELPDCEIHWEVPFQGAYYPENTTELSLTAISDEEIPVLAYLPELQAIDATGSREYAQLVKLQAAYPDVQISYTVPVDGREYSQDTTEVTLSHLTDEEVALMDYLPQLAAVNAESCPDYAQLEALQQRHPECTIRTIAGEIIGEDITELTLTAIDCAQLPALLDYLTSLKHLHLVDPAGEAASLLQLLEDHPEVSITWEKEVLGLTLRWDTTEVDFSGIAMSGVEEVESALAYFPAVEKVIMCDCGIDNETMAAFRERNREAYKVVWSVVCGGIIVRTDDIFFHPIQEHVYYFYDEDAYNLRYCEDMICVDLGHMSITNIDFVEYMPNLKYFIVACCGNLRDITPISSCKNLIFLEIFMTAIKDYTPLLGCTALEDLNLGDTYGDPNIIAQMTWLKNVWWSNRASAAPVLRAALPNTFLQFAGKEPANAGWRKLPNYYDMRDILGMEYMD